MTNTSQSDTRLRRLLATIRQSFRGLVSRVNSAPDIQRVQISALADETVQNIELMQQFGFTSVPPPDAHTVVLPLHGKTSHSVIIATEHGSYRVRSLNSGEVAVYNQSGAKIVLKAGRLIEIECDTLTVNCQCYNVNASELAQFTTPTLNTSEVFTAQGQINGNGGLAIAGGAGASVAGGLRTTEDVVAGGVSLMRHTHAETQTETKAPS